MTIAPWFYELIDKPYSPLILVGMIIALVVSIWFLQKIQSIDSSE